MGAGTWWLRLYKKDDPFWTSIVFSDETKKGCTDMDHSSWQYADEERHVKERSHWTSKIHLWGYIGPGGVRKLVLLPPGTVDATVYLDQLQQTLGKAHWNQKYIWQQDGATAHTAKEVVEWLTKHKFHCLTRVAKQIEDQWPPDREPVVSDVGGSVSAAPNDGMGAVEVRQGGVGQLRS